MSFFNLCYRRKFALHLKDFQIKAPMACTTILPPTHADLCDPQVNFGEISTIAFTRLGDGLTSVTDLAEWNTRLDNTSAIPGSGLAPIRQLFGIGSLVAPQRNEIRISKKRKYYTTPKFTFEFKVEDTGDVNWEFIRSLPVGGQTFTAWFMTEDHVFGGNAGLQVTLIPNPNIPESIDEIQTINLTVTFEGEIPQRSANPLVDSVGSGSGGI